MMHKCTAPVIFVDNDGTSENLFQHIGAALAAGAQSLLLLACDANGFTPDLLDERLKAIPVPIFGGIFPQIVAVTHSLERGSVVCGLPMPVSVHHLGKLSDASEDYLLQTRKLEATLTPGSTLIVLVDGLGKRISALLESLYGELGDDYPYIGGGAGSLTFVQKPCLFSNQGLLEDCAQITALDLPVTIGIEHGWHIFAGPFFVTGAHDNTITSLDYRPAFEVYQKVVEAHSGKRFADKPFFELSKAYPFGLARLKKNVVVRDPFFRRGNDLVCVGEVPANHMVYILTGDAENLLAASQQCALSVTHQQPDGCLALLFDCASRALFLEGRLQEEISNIHKHLPDGLPLLGVLSLGEIADAGNACLEFFNKTTVLGIFAEKGYSSR